MDPAIALPVHARMVSDAIRRVRKEGRKATYSELLRVMEAPKDSLNHKAWKDANLQRGANWLGKRGLITKEDGEYKITVPSYYFFQELIDDIAQERKRILEVPQQSWTPEYIEQVLTDFVTVLAWDARDIQEALILTYLKEKDPAGFAKNWRGGRSEMSRRMASTLSRRLAEHYRSEGWNELMPDYATGRLSL